MSRRSARDRLRLVDPPQPTDAPTVGVFVEISPAGEPIVSLGGTPHIAETAVELGETQIGRRVLVAFIDGDARRPVITGVLGSKVVRGTARRTELRAEELFLRGEQEITLVCGQASITLTKDGRITLRGVDLLSRVSGTQRLRGGSIQLN